MSTTREAEVDPSQQGFLRGHVPQLLACASLVLVALLLLAWPLQPDAWEPGRGGSLVAIPAAAAALVVSVLMLLASALLPVALYLRHRKLAGALSEPAPEELA